HLGLSRELMNMDPREHIDIISRLLDENPNLMLDISWSIIAEGYFDTPARPLYVDFINRYPRRILAGTDFVASDNKNMLIYNKEVEATSGILAEVNDEAFRQIALGQNYFDLAPGLAEQFQAPAICANEGEEE